MSFEFVTSDRIIFGDGTLSQVAEIAPGMGQRALILGGGGSVSMDRLFQFLNIAGVAFDLFCIEQEPDIPTITDGLSKAKSAGSDFVIGFGGGSVLDSAKAIAALINNPGDVLDYLEVIGGGKKIPNPAVPMIAIPTTAGTGTEVTRNAVITSPEHHVKVSMRSPMMIPTVALVDPELTYSMPPQVTASTGMDALTQVIEAYVSKKANPMTDILARDGIQRGARSLLAAYKNGDDQQARYDMALTSLLGGLALANGGLGAVHGFAGPIGGLFNAAHGEICASLLSPVMKYNLQTILNRDGIAEIKTRYEDIAKWLTGDPNAKLIDGLSWIENLTKALSIPGLQVMGVQRADFDGIIEKAKVSSSMQRNPIKLDEKTLKTILSEAY